MTHPTIIASATTALLLAAFNAPAVAAPVPTDVLVRKQIILANTDTLSRDTPYICLTGYTFRWQPTSHGRCRQLTPE